MTDTAQNCTALTRRQEEAARLVAGDECTDEAIATALKISRRTLAYWRKRPNFAARVQEHREAWRAAIMREGIADRVQRVRVLADLDARLRRVITERAADPEMAKVKGGDTGLLTRKLRTVRGPDGKSAPVWEYSVDTATVAEIRAVHEQVAKELGQWVEKHEHAKIDPRKWTDQQLLAYKAGVPLVQVLSMTDDGSTVH